MTIEPWYEDLEALDRSEGAIVVDPLTPERYFWTDPATTVKREIWRPGKTNPSCTCTIKIRLTVLISGDGDGDRFADYFDKPGPATPLETRWKFYQSRTGPGPTEYRKNEPPKYVFLDDRAASEVIASDIPRARLTKYWPHDFSGNGVIRARRANRGRGAVGDFEASGKEMFHFAMIANKTGGDRYYFTGEANYQPVIWSTDDYDLAIGVFQPEINKLPTLRPKKGLKWNQHGHNQFTPKDKLVKFGAPRKGASYRPNKDRSREPDGNVRGGRNRVQPLAAISASEVREDSSGRESSGGPRSAKRRRLNSRSTSQETEGGEDNGSRETEGDKDNGSYIENLERFLVQSKEITDEQKAEIDELEQTLFEANMRIRSLEMEVARLQQEQ